MARGKVEVPAPGSQEVPGPRCVTLRTVSDYRRIEVEGVNLRYWLDHIVNNRNTLKGWGWGPPG